MLRRNPVFVLRDYIAGALVGLLTAGAVHRFVRPTMDTVLAMIFGMVLRMIVHLNLWGCS